MEQNIISKSMLFSGLKDYEIQTLLNDLGTITRKAYAGETLLSSGERTTFFGMVIFGTLQIKKQDINGNSILLSQIGGGELFAEAFACAENPLSVTVIALSDARILWIDFHRLIRSSSETAFFVRERLLKMIARKNIFLTARIEHLSKKSIREKVLSFLQEQADVHKSRSFRIPFNRQELADYLATDRSALSAVLSSLRRDHILIFRRNYFELL